MQYGYGLLSYYNHDIAKAVSDIYPNIGIQEVCTTFWYHIILIDFMFTVSTVKRTNNSNSLRFIVQYSTPPLYPSLLSSFSLSNFSFRTTALPFSLILSTLSLSLSLACCSATSTPADNRSAKYSGFRMLIPYLQGINWPLWKHIVQKERSRGKEGGYSFKLWERSSSVSINFFSWRRVSVWGWCNQMMKWGGIISQIILTLVFDLSLPCCLILQYWSASLVISDINFWAANAISLFLFLLN